MLNVNVFYYHAIYTLIHTIDHDRAILLTPRDGLNKRTLIYVCVLTQAVSILLKIRKPEKLTSYLEK
jgi:hypothetical protein